MGMDCRNFSGYVSYSLPTFEMDLLPAEVREHLEVCSKCRDKLAELRQAHKSRLSDKKDKAGKNPISKLAGAMRDLIRRSLLVYEQPQVSCRKVRPFLYYAVDPLARMFAPGWMSLHLSTCDDCKQEYWRLSQLRETVIAAAMAPGQRYRTQDGTLPEDIPCGQVEPYHYAIATCNQDPPVPLEMYLHVRYCRSCYKQMIQLRRDLNVRIPKACGGPITEPVP